MVTRSHTHRKSRLASTGNRSAGVRGEHVAHALHPGIWALVLVGVIVAVTVASIVPRSGADPVGVEPPSMHPGIAVSLPGGVDGMQLRGVVYAPGDYSPPGIYRLPSDPGVR
jgi:hypothetical protein